MLTQLEELINEKRKLEGQIYAIVDRGIETIDRILWELTAEDYEHNEYWNVHEIPKDFSIDKFKIVGSVLKIEFSYGYRGEDYGHFFIPLIYFEDKEIYERDLADERQRIADKQEKERLKIEEEERAAAIAEVNNKRELLDELIEMRNAGLI